MKNINNKLTDVDGVDFESNKTGAAYNFKAINPSDTNAYAYHNISYSGHNIYAWDNVTNNKYSTLNMFTDNISMYTFGNTDTDIYSSLNLGGNYMQLYAQYSNSPSKYGYIKINGGTYLYNYDGTNSSELKMLGGQTDINTSAFYLNSGFIQIKPTDFMTITNGSSTESRMTVSSSYIGFDGFTQFTSRPIFQTGLSTSNIYDATGTTNLISMSDSSITLQKDTQINSNDNNTKLNVNNTEIKLISDGQITIDAPEIVLTNNRYGAQELTFDGSTMLFNISHGLGVVPSYFSLTFSDGKNTEFIQSLRTVDSNRITIECENPPTGSMIVYWQVYK